MFVLVHTISTDRVYLISHMYVKVVPAIIAVILITQLRNIQEQRKHIILNSSDFVCTSP